MKKVLFIVYAMSGGVGRVVTMLVNALACHFDISVLEIYHYSDCRYSFNKKIKFLGSLIDEKKDSREIAAYKKYCIEQHSELLRAAYELNGYDAIVACDYMIPSYLLKAFPDVPCVDWVHTTLQRLAGKDNKIIFNVQKNIWETCEKIMLISKAEYRIMQKIMPYYLNKTNIVYNPFDADEVRRKATAPCDFQFCNYDFPFACCIGRFDKNKNFELAVRAIKQLQNENIAFGLILIGSGDEEKNLRALVKQLQVQDRVFFLGQKQNPYPYLTRCLCLCSTSLQETWGMVACEAMALGIPFITTPVSGASEELASDETCGLVTPYNDADSYAEKIKMLLNDKKRYANMSENCVEQIKKFTTEKAVREWFELLNGLPSKKSKYKLCDKNTALQKIKRMYIFSYRWQNITIIYQRYLNTFLKSKSLKSFLQLVYYTLRSLSSCICGIPLRLRDRKLVLRIFRDLQ